MWNRWGAGVSKQEPFLVFRGDCHFHFLKVAGMFTPSLYWFCSWWEGSDELVWFGLVGVYVMESC
jgi:hypothetical protein